MNEYCSFNFQTKMVLNIPISRMQEKMQFLEQSINCLYYGTLHRVNLRPIWS